MSAPGPIDEDTARTIESGRQTLGVFLKTAQQRLKVVFVAFVLGLFAGVIAMRLWIWPTLRAALLVRGASIIAQSPFEVILLQVKIGLVVGVVTALPVLLYYAKRPLADRGLIPDVSVSRWKLAVIALIAVALSLVGVAYAYFLFFPILFKYLASNAISSGFTPMYGIVHWTEFILALSAAFALASEMPLVMTSLSYWNVVSPRTWRAYLRHATLGMVVLGTMINGSPEPVSALIIAIPLTVLYGVGILTSRLVAHRGQTGGEVVTTASLGRVLLGRWNVIAAVAVAGGGVGYVLWNYTGLDATIAATVGVGADTVGISLIVIGALLSLSVAVAEIALYERREVVETESESSSDSAPGAAATADSGTERAEAAESGSDAMSREALENAPSIESVHGASGVRAMPEEVFAAMDEDDALEAARRAMDRDEPEKARAIFDRFDAAPEHGPDRAGTGIGETISETGVGVFNAFTEEETTEDDIGGYYHDIAFILDSLRSRAFHLVAVFLTVMAAIFMFLYRGGIGIIRADFISRIPPEVRPDPGSVQWPIALHPVEALVFEAKISVLIAAVVTLPVLLYFAWPALERRGLVTGNRRVVLVWGVSIIGGVLAGSVVGYLYVAPSIISYLVADALRAGMVVAYRLSSFFWLVFFTTAGVGLLADIPITMWLFHRGGIVSYERMRESWRGIVLVIFVFSTFFSSQSVWTMFLLAIPTSAAYLLGLGVLWVVTLGGRRGGSSRTAESTT
ncbi:MAG: twin-arginine translocase subunit TatC [Halodesulfurarchaeum sp.]